MDEVQIDNHKYNLLQRQETRVRSETRVHFFFFLFIQKNTTPRLPKFSSGQCKRSNILTSGWEERVRGVIAPDKDVLHITVNTPKLRHQASLNWTEARMTTHVF